MWKWLANPFEITTIIKAKELGLPFAFYHSFFGFELPFCHFSYSIVCMPIFNLISPFGGQWERFALICSSLTFASSYF